MGTQPHVFVHNREHAVDKSAWRAKADEYIQEISRAKAASKWKEYVNNANGKTIWQIKKYITNTPTSTSVPTLNGNAATNEQKSVHFVKPSSRNHLEQSSQISQQIQKAVSDRLAPDKAPHRHEISNRALKSTLPVIEHHLLAIMQVSIRLGHFPKLFKHTATVILRQPRRLDYTKVNAYRPIALENTLGTKVMEVSLQRSLATSLRRMSYCHRTITVDAHGEALRMQR